MNVWPLKFRPQPDGHLLFADDAGGFFRADDRFLSRYAHGRLTPGDERFLLDEGHAFRDEEDLAHAAFAVRWAKRQCARRDLSYVILIPTLRCNLSCVYCQVSRAAENARGYDWDTGTLAHVLRFLDELETEEIKVEFQGGEPLLRIDLLEEVRRFCRGRFAGAQFVVCTNLQKLGAREWAFLEEPDTFVSTSLDGDIETHNRQRTQNPKLAAEFFRNLFQAIERLGSSRVSALPTIDSAHPPDLPRLIDTFERLGITSIYLRPVNYHGFARRKGPDALQRWNVLHSQFIDLLIERNLRTGRMMEEYDFSHCLKRVLRPGHDHHVDIRNPNLLGTDYVVIDYDGSLYPTDEARMLSRIGRIDLSIGNIAEGIDPAAVEHLNAWSFNNFDPDCIHCPYQAFCGTDTVDDISRYGRIDLPRLDTWFCGRQMAVFDKIFALLYARDEKIAHSLTSWAGLASLPPGLAPSLP